MHFQLMDSYAPRLMPTATANAYMNTMRPPPVLPLLLPSSVLHDGMHTMECTRWNAHDGMHTIECTQWNGYNGMRTIEFGQRNPHNGVCMMEFVQWNPYDRIRTMESVRWSPQDEICIRTMECARWNSLDGMRSASRLFPIRKCVDGSNL